MSRTGRKRFSGIDAYISQFPADTRKILEQIRTTVRAAAPAAEETIKYGMPTFTLAGNLVHFAAFKNHIGFFPPVRGDEKLKEAAAAYAGPKGNLKFPLDLPIPYALIARIVKLRIKQNGARAEAKSKRR